MEYEKLSVHELNKRFPIINTSDLHHAYFDPYGGCLRARETCQAVYKSFLEEGGTYVQAYAKPGKTEAGRLVEIQLSNGTSVQSDNFIFACGSWLGSLFPKVLGKIITCTKQEVYYFGVPSEDAELFEKFPVWVDVDGKDFYYGIPGNNYRGFKIGVDKRGELFNPTASDHIADPTVLADARKFISHRFPALKNAPVVESRVCPYENSPDGTFCLITTRNSATCFFLAEVRDMDLNMGPLWAN
jgi:glycine/D-amino acid oxidase-like deaminating enzyme